MASTPTNTVNHMTTVSADLKARVQTRVEECMAIARKQWPHISFDTPKTIYEVTTTTAGYARYGKWEIDLNPVLLNSQPEAFIARTVGHEVAHLISYRVYGRPGAGHGPKWKHVMRVFGQEPTRCHSYDTQIEGIKTKRTASFTCDCGGHGAMTPAKARKMMGGTYFHRCADGMKRTIRAASIRMPDAKPAPVPRPKQVIRVVRNIGAGATVKLDIPVSKIEHCREIKKNNPDATRSQLIALFVAQAGCTPAGSATYYATLKKED